MDIGVDTTIWTDNEYHDIVCIIQAMKIFAEDGYGARMIDYLKFQELYENNQFDPKFLITLKNIEKKCLKSLKKLGAPTPKKYNKK